MCEKYILSIGCTDFIGLSLEAIWNISSAESRIGMSGSEYLIWFYTHELRHALCEPECYVPLGQFLKNHNAIGDRSMV